MCPGDRSGDRQAETRSVARTRVVGTAEAVERAWQELGREAAAFVADVELDLAVPFDRREPDPPLRGPLDIERSLVAAVAARTRTR